MLNKSLETDRGGYFAGLTAVLLYKALQSLQVIFAQSRFISIAVNLIYFIQEYTLFE